MIYKKYKALALIILLFCSSVNCPARADEVSDAFSLLISGKLPENFFADSFLGDENFLSAACHVGLMTTFTTTTYQAFVAPPPQDLGYTLAAYSSNLGLKHCKPQLVAPEDLILEKSSDNQCVGVLNQSRVSGGYSNSFGFDDKRDLLDWGDLSPEKVSHRNSKVFVQILDFPIESIYDKDDLQRSFALGAGRYDITYRADTLISQANYIPFYVPKVPKGTGRWSKFVAKHPKVAKRVLQLRTVANGLNKLRQTLAFRGLLDLDEDVDDLFLFFNSYPHSFFDNPDVFATDTQSIFVFDDFNPTLEFSTDLSSLEGVARELISYDALTNTYFVEATSPRGVEREFIAPLLENTLIADDACGRGPLVTTSSTDNVGSLWPIDTDITVTWKATDAGPSNIDMDRRSVTRDMIVKVRDTKPPIILAPPNRVFPVTPGGSTGLVSPGIPRVFDVADFSVNVTNDANLDVDGLASFDEGLHEIEWTATDASQNSAKALQLLVVKDPSGNTTPQAMSQVGALAVDAVTFEPIEIVLEGLDPDTWFSERLQQNVNEPISFEISSPPNSDKGFFKAELTPFFIDDYRVGSQNFNELKQQDPEAYCDSVGSENWEIEYPFRAEWMTVDDNNNSYVIDLGNAVCDEGNLIQERRRVLKISSDGTLTSKELNEAPEPPRAFFWDNIANTMFASYDNNGEPRLIRVDSDLSLTEWNMDQGSGDYPGFFGQLRALAADVTNNFLIAFDTAANSGEGIKIFDLATAGNGASNPPEFDRDLSFDPIDDGIQSMTLDADGNLYTANSNGRIYKYQLRDESGNYLRNNEGKLSPTFVGWMGRCETTVPQDIAPLCNEDQYPDEADKHKRHSYGFVCTDALCTAPTTEGTEIGQFTTGSNQGYNSMDITFSPDNVMYVAEPPLNRVQRFTPDGLPAGVARSTGVGFGFILGDFDDVTYIETNRDHFFLLDRNSNLLHSFKTTPLTPLDRNSDGLVDAAKVTYQSNTDFPQTDSGTDSFSFTVSDGITTSAPAIVDINVTRNYRPPEIISEPLVFTIQEDSGFPAPLALQIREFDFQDVGNIELMVDREPQHGSVNIVGNIGVTYTPDANFAGQDTFSLKAIDGSTPPPAQAENNTTKEALEFTINVTPQPDSPSFESEDETSVIALRGYNYSFGFTAFDPDVLEPEETMRLSIDWGDGSITESGDMLITQLKFQEYLLGADGVELETNSNGATKLIFPANYPDDYPDQGDALAGTELFVSDGPILIFAEESNVRMDAMHAYDTTGQKTIKVCQTITHPDRQDTGGCNNSIQTINVIEAPKLDIFVQPSTDIAKAGDSISFNVSISNPLFDTRASSSSSNNANNILYRISVQENLILQNVTPQFGNCGPLINAEVSCVLDQPLAYGESFTINLDAIIDENAPSDERYGVIIEATTESEFPDEDAITIANYFFAVGAVEVGLDTDGDGVFDQLDDFPYLANFQTDTDDDGIADALDAWPDDPRYSSGGRVLDPVDSSSNSGVVDQIIREFMLPEHSEIVVSFTILGPTGSGNSSGNDRYSMDLDGQNIVSDIRRRDLPFSTTLNLEHSSPDLELRFTQTGVNGDSQWGVEGIEIRWDTNDADGDGLNDNVDPLPMDPDPTAMDTDKDGKNDSVDNCPAEFNPLQENTDNDVSGDVCDDDDDNDSVPDLAPDNCQYIANANQRDTDNDLFGDACDPDDDNDNVFDEDDNCPLIANENQQDENNNGVGDLCEDDSFCFVVKAINERTFPICL